MEVPELGCPLNVEVEVEVKQCCLPLHMYVHPHHVDAHVYHCLQVVTEILNR